MTSFWLRRTGKPFQEWAKHRYRALKAKWFWRRYGNDPSCWTWNSWRAVWIGPWLRIVGRPRVISIRIMQALGDTIFTIPALLELKKRDPELLIEIVAPDAAQTKADVWLKACQAVNRIVHAPSPWAWKRVDLCAYFLHLGIPHKKSLTGDYPGVAREHHYFKIARMIGAPMTRLPFPHIETPLSPEARKKVDDFVKRLKYAGPVIGFEPFCKGDKKAKQWHMENFRELFTRLKAAIPNVQLVILPKDPYDGFANLGVHDGSSLNLMEVAYFVTQIDLAVVLQSGLGALAGALDAALVQLNGGTPLGWNECVNPRASVIDQLRPWDINSITPEMVFAEILRRLQPESIPGAYPYKRITFLNYGYLPHYYGPSGGHWVNRALIQEGQRRGHAIRAFNPPDAVHVPESSDAYLLGDIYATTKEWGNFPLSVLDRIMSSGFPYATFDNGYGVCEILDPALPCRGLTPRTSEGVGRSLKRCGHVAGRGEKTPFNCSFPHAIRLYRGAAINVFMSPLHKSVYDDLLGPGVIGDWHAAGPLACDPDFFIPQEGIERKENRYLYVGSISKIKGYEEIRDRFFSQKGIEVWLAGKLHPTVADEFERDCRQAKAHVRWLGPVERERLPALYSSAGHFIHFPTFPEPFALTVVEASLCGCRILANPLVGALSWSDHLDDRERIRRCAGETWDRLEAAWTGKQKAEERVSHVH